MASTSKMTRETLWDALTALGRRARRPVSLILGGSAALILDGDLRRPTDDGDVVASEPEIGDLQALIRDVAEHEQLPPGWLNGSIQSYTYILPRDYRERLVPLAPFGRLTVSLLDRRDVILMKIYGQRPRDVQDLHAIGPTPGELEFVRAQLPRIATKEKERADSMRAFLDEWEAQT